MSGLATGKTVRSVRRMIPGEEILTDASNVVFYDLPNGEIVSRIEMETGNQHGRKEGISIQEYIPMALLRGYSHDALSSKCRSCCPHLGSHRHFEGLMFLERKILYVAMIGI